MKDWRIQSNCSFDGDNGRYALTHHHKPDKGLPIAHAMDDFVRKCKYWKGKWYCPLCKKRAPKYMEDVAMLAQCDHGDRIHPNWDRRWRRNHEKKKARELKEMEANSKDSRS